MRNRLRLLEARIQPFPDGLRREDMIGLYYMIARMKHFATVNVS